MSRRHHFQMKYLLAQMALQSPGRFFAKFQPEGDTAYLADLWTAFGLQLEPAERVAAAGIAAWHRAPEADVCEAVVITLPPPTQRGEAYYLGALSVDGGCRVFCLEHSVNPLTHQPSAMLSELAAHGRANWGEVVAPSSEDFLTVVEAIINDPDASPNSFIPMQLA